MEPNEHEDVSTYSYNTDAPVISTHNHSVSVELKRQGMQYKTKKKKARFFEQFCEYIIMSHDKLKIFNGILLNCVGCVSYKLFLCEMNSFNI